MGTGAAPPPASPRPGPKPDPDARAPLEGVPVADAAARLGNPVKVVVPTPAVEGAGDDLLRIAEGFAADLVDLVRRLGGAWAAPLYLAPPEQDASASDAVLELDREEVDARTADRLLADFGAHALVAAVLRTGGDDELEVGIQLRRRGGRVAWRASTRFVDGTIREARLSLASDVLAAVTGRPTDAGALADLGTSSLPAWLAVCAARHHRDDLETRAEAALRATVLDPGYAEAWLLRSELALAAGDAEGAAALAGELPRAFPRLGRAWLARARARASAGDRSGAASDLADAIARPLDGPSLLEAAHLAATLADPTLSQRLLERARDARLMDPLLFDRLGSLRQRQRREVEAVALWERAYVLSRSIRGLRSRLAVGHARLGNQKRAAEMYEEALARDSRSAETRYWCGVYARELGGNGEALEHLDAALRLDPDHVPARVLRGGLRVEAGLAEEARADLEHALRIDSEGTETAEARMHLRRLLLGPEVVDRATRLLAEGAAAIRRGDHAGAVPPVGEALRLLPDYWQAWFFLGTAHRMAGRWVPAEGAFRQVLHQRPDQADAWNELSIALLEQGRGPEALAAARRAHDLRPGDASILSNLGVALLDAADLAAAREAFERAEQARPGDGLLRQCFAELERREEAAGMAPRPRSPRAGSAGHAPARAQPPPRVDLRLPAPRVAPEGLDLPEGERHGTVPPGGDDEDLIDGAELRVDPLTEEDQPEVAVDDADGGEAESAVPEPPSPASSDAGSVGVQEGAALPGPDGRDPRPASRRRRRSRK